MDTSFKPPPPSQLPRTDSYQSIPETYSTTDDLADSSLDLLKRCKQFATKIGKDSNTLTTDSLKVFKLLKKLLNTLIERQTEEAKARESLEKHARNTEEVNYQLRSLLQISAENQLSEATVARILDRSLSTHLSSLTEAVNAKLNEMESLKEQLLQMTRTPPPSETPTTSQDGKITSKTSAGLQDTPTHTTPLTQENAQPENTNPLQNASTNAYPTRPELVHQRTLVIRHRRTEGSNPTGRQILHKIQEQSIACPTSAIEVIHTRRFHIEIVCTSAYAHQEIKRTLQLHQVLNRILTVSTKQMPKQKMILFNVANNLNSQYILDSIKVAYNVIDSDITITRNVPSKIESAKNWHIVLPIGLGQAIIRNGGLRIGKKAELSRSHATSPPPTHTQKKHEHLAR